MASNLLQPPTSASPETSLQLSEQAPSFFAAQSSWLSRIPYPLNLFINTESQEKWQIYENIFQASLRTGDAAGARQSLLALEKRFGPTNERVLALRGLFQEATAEDGAALKDVVEAYNDILAADPTIFSARKRRAAALRFQGKTSDAISALANILDSTPVDAECWAELADIYAVQGAYEPSIFCLEEVLLITPNAWNMHAKLAEVLYVYALSLQEGSADQTKILSESMRRVCRSIELCDNYLRGYYGLKLTTSRLIPLLDAPTKKSNAAYTPSAGELPAPRLESVRKLNELATSKLAEIVRRYASGSSEWNGYDPIEITAARELLDKETRNIQRPACDWSPRSCDDLSCLNASFNSRKYVEQWLRGHGKSPLWTNCDVLETIWTCQEL